MKRLLIAALVGFISTAAWALTPGAPSNVTVTNVSPTEQQVCWTDNSSNEDGFTVLRQGGSSVNVGPNVVCQNFTGLTPATPYTYDVNGFINPGASAAASGGGTTLPLPPTAPSGLLITNVSATEQNVCWTDNSNNEDSFNVVNTTLSVTFNTAANALCQGFTGLSPLTSYNYEVKAHNISGYSAIISGSLTTPAPPPVLSIVAWVDPTNPNVLVPREVKPLCTGGQLPAINNCSTDKVRKLAFPSAQGYGRFASPLSTGAWTVYKVTNLNDSGAGSFRTAYTATGPRVIVFDVSGTITLNSPMIIQDANGSNIYIAGQTSPGGIQFAAGAATTSGPIRTVRIKDGIFRYLKTRPGVSHAPSTNVQGFGAIAGQITAGAWASTDIIADHITSQWATDEVFAATGVDNFTMQWSMTSEPISCGACRTDANSQHDFSGAFLVTNNRITAHHNLIMTGLKRMPNVAGNAVDVTNNVLYNEGFVGTVGYAGTYATNNSTIINYVGNWFSHGPRTTNGQAPAPTNQKPHCLQMMKEGTQAAGTGAEAYAAGNICPHDLTGLDNSDVVFVDPSTPLLKNLSGGTQIVFATPRAGGVGLPTTDAPTALAQVLSWAGSRQDVHTGTPRADAAEQRSVDQVRNCDNHSYSPAPGRITAIPAGGYPNLATNGTWTAADTDNDGMSDAWETTYFGNLSRDGKGDFDSDGWYDLEEYLNMRAGEGVVWNVSGSLPAPGCSWPAQ